MSPSLHTVAGPAAAARSLLWEQLGSGSVRESSFALLHGLYWLGVNLAVRRPLVVAVDDAHLADEPSLRWLAYLAARLDGLALALVVALRPVEPASGEGPLMAVRAAATAVVRPQLLSLDAVTAMTRERLGAQVSDELCGALSRTSGGNPFYIAELLRALELQTSAPTEADPAELAARAGEGVTGRVALRIRGLDPGALRLAQSLAVLGDGCELRHAAALTEIDTETALRLVAGLVRLEVLAGVDPARFLHPIVRDAVEASLGSGGRELAHRRAARLEARAHAAVLRRLLRESSGLMARLNGNTLVMCSYDRFLAGLAAVDGDHDEADRLFTAAVAQEEAVRSPPLVCRTKHWWGRALARRGEPDRARPLLDDARASAERLGMRGVVSQIDDLLSSDLFGTR